MQPETPAWLWDAKQATDAIGQFIDGVDEDIDYEIVWTAVTVHMQELGSTIDRLLRNG